MYVKHSHHLRLYTLLHKALKLMYDWIKAVMTVNHAQRHLWSFNYYCIPVKVHLIQQQCQEHTLDFIYLRKFPHYTHNNCMRTICTHYSAVVSSSHQGLGSVCQPGAELRCWVRCWSPWLYWPGLQREKEVLCRHRLLLQTVSYTYLFNY